MKDCKTFHLVENALSLILFSHEMRKKIKYCIAANNETDGKWMVDYKTSENPEKVDIPKLITSKAIDLRG